ncbi:MAG: hypothetical protein MZV70_53655 [Desulfobacterales bacterium]|nr:hypothetical protein [Desulfobacterales bacterium]
MLCAVLKQWHPITGVDFHIPWPPGSPSPAPSPVPYKTCTTMFGIGIKASTAATHVQQGFGLTMQGAHRCGHHDPARGAPSVTLPIDMAFSASKSYFGPASTECQGQRIGAALLQTVNLNLDCGIPRPTPTGVVIAFVSVYTNMSLADIMYGFNAMAIDWCVQTVLNALGNGIGNMAGNLLGRFGPQVMSRAAAKQLLRSRGGIPGNMINQAARDFARSQREAYSRMLARNVPAHLGNAVNAVTGFFGGGPMGADGGDVGLWTPGGAAGDAAQGYLNGPGPADHGGSGMAAAARPGIFREEEGSMPVQTTPSPTLMQLSGKDPEGRYILSVLLKITYAIMQDGRLEPAGEAGSPGHGARGPPGYQVPACPGQ